MTTPIASLSEKHLAPTLQDASPIAPSAAAVGDAGPSGFARVLGRLGAELDRGERLVARAASGGAVDDASALIALQAGIYRYTETVDLAAKLVNAATNAVRTTLSSGH